MQLQKCHIRNIDKKALTPKEIVRLKAESNYCSVITTKGRFLLSKTMKSIFEILPSNVFLKVHKSHIVNINLVEKTNNESVIMENGDKVPISRRRKKKVLENISQIVASYILLSFFSFNSYSQTTYTASPSEGTYNNCPSNNINESCPTGIFLGNTIRFKVHDITSNNFIFRAKKCNESQFISGGTGYVKTGGVCGVIEGTDNINANDYFSTVSIPIPSNFLSGTKTYYFTINSDSSEKFHAGTVTITAIPPACPDLEVTGYSVSPNHIYPGEDINMTSFVQNTGNASAGSSTLYYYLDTNSGSSTPSTNIGSDGVSSLSPNSQSLESFSISTNPDATTGIYYMKWRADATDVVDECDNGENNNVEFRQLWIDPIPGSFLELDQEMTISPSPVIYNQTANFSSEIVNNSTGHYFGDLRFDLLNSNGTLIDIIAYEPTNYQSANIEIPPGSSNSYTFSHTTPSPVSTTPGQYKLRVMYSDNNGTSWSVIDEANYVNPKDFCITNDPGAISITSPQQNYAYAKYDNQGNLDGINITWSAPDVPGNLTIEYTDPNENNPVLIVSNTPNDGSYTWNFSNGINPEEYKVKIYQSGTCGVAAFSNIFKVLSNVQLSSPPDNSVFSSPPSNITYSWNNPNPVMFAEYEIRLRDITSNTVLLDWVDTDNETSHLHSYNYEAGHDYRWVVRAKAGVNNEIIESEAVDFSIEENSVQGELRLSTSISITPSNPIQGESASFVVAVENFGNATWAGNVVMQLLDVNQGYIDDLDLESITLLQGQSYTLSFSTNDIQSDAGDYYIRVQEQENGSGPWLTTLGNGFQNPKPFMISPPTSGTCDYFSDLPNSGNDTEAFEAAQCLCSLGYVLPQDYDMDGTADEVNPDQLIYRADLAKLVYFAIYQGDASNPAANFPVPFTDLQTEYSGNDYYEYAIALSYLEYGDGISPFTRNFINFLPYDNILKKYALKVILEAYNIAPDNSNGGTIQSVMFGDDAYGYVHKAFDMGLIAGTTADANTFVLRRDIFIILHRLLSYDSCPDCDASCLDPNPQLSDYFMPPNITASNLARSADLNEGYFSHTAAGGLTINARKIPTVFKSSYSSYLAELPDGFTPVTPLGKGWTHTYNSYMIKVPGWSAQGITHPQRLLTFWPSGAIDYYDENNLPMSESNYDEILSSSGSTIVIKKKNQMKYYYQKYGNSSPEVYYLIRIEDRNLNKIQISYQSSSEGYRIYEITGTSGKKLRFSYSGSENKIESVKDLTGNRTLYYDVDVQNNLVYYTNARGKTENYNYGSSPQFNLLEEITRPEGNKLTNVYDAMRAFKHTSIKDGNTEIYRLDVDVNYSYSSNNPSLTSTITDINTTKTIEFNSNGTINTTTTEVGGTDINTTLEYGDTQNSFLPSNIEYGSQTENIALDYEYDNEGNLEKMILPNGSFHQYTYNTKNDVVTYKDPENNVYTFGYNGFGNLTTITDPLGHVTTYVYNNNIGDVDEVLNPENIETEYYYDTDGNVFWVKQPLNINTFMGYDNINRLTSITNPKNQVTTIEYDEHDQTKKKTRISTGGNIITEYFYDDNDNLEEIENVMGNSTIFTYDKGDKVKTMQFGNDVKEYDYYKDTKPKTYKKPDGTILTQVYDEQDRIENDGYASYTYDDLGNVETITSGGNTLVMTYDIQNRLKTVTDYFGKQVEYNYDNNSNVTKIEYPNGFDVDYEYDAADRLEKVKWDSGSKIVMYTYLDDNRIDRIDYPNGSFCTYDYDAAGRMTGMTTRKSNNEVINSYAYTLDPLGNHTNIVKTEPYGVPSLKSMVDAKSYNIENEPNDESFDQNGNQTTLNGNSSSWNIVDLPTMLNGTTYEYDGLKLRRKTTINGTIRKYVWDIRGMGNILMELNNSNGVEGYYIHGHGLLAKVDDGQSYYYHSDYRGSTIAMTDQSQNLVNKYNYSPFGFVTDQLETIDNPFKYVGAHGVMSDADGLHYMRARYMDSKSGRFLSEDPIWHENLFPYADNNPVNLIDPKGEQSAKASETLVPNPSDPKEIPEGDKGSTNSNNERKPGDSNDGTRQKEKMRWEKVKEETEEEIYNNLNPKTGWEKVRDMSKEQLWESLKSELYQSYNESKEGFLWGYENVLPWIPIGGTYVYGGKLIYRASRTRYIIRAIY